MYKIGQASKLSARSITQAHNLRISTQSYQYEIIRYDWYSYIRYIRHVSGFMFFTISVLRNPTGGRFPKRVYSNLNGHATEITDGAGRRTEISRNFETSVEENFLP